jgi:FtsZ-binding cell division protein ZapB
VIKNARLVEENETLKRQLRQSSATISSELAHEGVVIDESDVAAEGYRHLMNKYNDLSKKYHDLSQEMKYLKRKNTAVMQKNKDMKESVRAWQEYADRQSGKHKSKSETKTGDDHLRLAVVHKVEDALPYIPSSPGSIATVRTPLSIAGTGRSSPTPIAPLTHPGAGIETGIPVVSPNIPHANRLEDAPNRSGSITPKPMRIHDYEQQPEDVERTAQTSPDVNTKNGVQSYLRPVGPSSSQTTVDETAGLPAPLTQAAPAADDDDDFPEVISTRSLKRKRGLPSKINVYADRSSDGTPVKPFRVKEEPLSSPPLTHNLQRKETIDLDDFASGVLHTPHHKKQKAPVPTFLAGTSRHQRSNSAPLTQSIKQESTVIESTAQTSEMHAAANIAEILSTEARALSEPTDPSNNPCDVLRSLDPNTVTDTQEQPPNKRLRTEFQKRAVHRILAESGEEPPPVDDDELRLPPSAARAKLNRKMHPIQDPRTPAKSSTATPLSSMVKTEQQPTVPTAPSRTTKTPVARGQLYAPQAEARSVARSGPAADNSPVWSMKTPEVRASIRKTPVSDARKQGRLRSRPVAELKLQDFKPNPVYNQGYSYAFSETVRKRGDRMCLPGCTNLQCCGSTFRTFAEAQAPLPLSQEEVLLEDYLGDAYDNMNMTQMSAEERQELILQARTKKMAKEAGKHREAYERRRTPPGFWRVDFPSTQEHQEDRARAKEQEKAIVQERWMEAQRRGGKWIFRDE